MLTKIKDIEVKLQATQKRQNVYGSQLKLITEVDNRSKKSNQRLSKLLPQIQQSLLLKKKTSISPIKNKI